MLRLAPLLAITLAACGAKTGLSVPDAPPSMDAPALDAGRDGGRDGGPDVPIDGCVLVSWPLVPRTAQAMFVLDRSTSMGWALSGPGGGGPSRFDVLGAALRSALPTYDSAIEMGALLYPADAGDTCTVDPGPAIPPGPLGASAVLGEVAASAPGGLTPTAEALRSAERWFSTHPDDSRARAVVLATDGAPNCNPRLDTLTCPCTNSGGLPVGGCAGDRSELCLDDLRTILVIEALAASGVPTYVIGIDGDPDPALSRVLTAMAVAGGRPNPRDPRVAYYPIARPEDLAVAFDRIQASIVSCSLSYAGTLLEGRPVFVRLDGAVVPRDPMHAEGWDFDETSPTTVVLYGEACMTALSGEHDLTIEQTCD